MKKRITLLLCTLTLMLLSGCSESDSSQHQHVYSKWINQVNATCTQDGVIGHYHCDECGMNFDREYNIIDNVIIPSSGHAYGNLIDEVPATCESNGIIAHYECANCKKTFDANKNEVTSLIIPKKSHQYGSWVPEVSGTCGKPGTKGHYQCSDCKQYFDADYKVIDDINIYVDHVGSHYEQKFPTYSAYGYKEFWHCDNCSHDFLEEPESGDFTDQTDANIDSNHIAYLPAALVINHLGDEKTAITTNNKGTATEGFVQGKISDDDFLQANGKSSDVYYEGTYSKKFTIGASFSTYQSGFGTFGEGDVLSAENERQAGVILSNLNHEVRIMLYGKTDTISGLKVIVDGIETLWLKENLPGVNVFNGSVGLGVFLGVTRADNRLTVYANGAKQIVLTKDSVGIASDLEATYPDGTSYDTIKGVIGELIRSTDRIGYTVQGVTNFSVIRDYFVIESDERAKLECPLARSGCERMEVEYGWKAANLKANDHAFYCLSEQKLYSFRVSASGVKWAQNETAPQSSNAIFMNKKTANNFHYGLDVTGASGTDGTVTRAGASVSFGHAKTFNYDLQFQYVIWDNTIRVIVGGLGTNPGAGKYVDINFGFNGLNKPTNNNGFRIELGRKSGEVYVYVQPISNGEYVGELKEAFHYNGDGYVTPNGATTERQSWNPANGTKSDSLGSSVVGTLYQLIARNDGFFFGTSHYASTSENKGLMYSNFVLDENFN